MLPKSCLIRNNLSEKDLEELSSELAKIPDKSSFSPGWELVSVNPLANGREDAFLLPWEGVISAIDYFDEGQKLRYTTEKLMERYWEVEKIKFHSANGPATLTAKFEHPDSASQSYPRIKKHCKVAPWRRVM